MLNLTAYQISLIFGAFSAGAVTGFGICLVVRVLASVWRGFNKIIVD